MSNKAKIVKAKIVTSTSRFAPLDLILIREDGTRERDGTAATNEADAMLSARVSHGLTTKGWRRNLCGVLVWRAR